MSAAFTPGPWMVEPINNGETYQVTDAKPEGFKVICETEGGSAEDAANARLIGTAPDLFNVLIMIGQWVEQVDRTPLIAARNIADAFRLYAAPALAAARGEA